ncbi:TPA: glycosyltransferase [Streptococcus suis]
MKLSIAMTLYNGEKFLVEQLDSIRLQTYEIDELIACDDGSTDNTKEIFNNYVRYHQLEKKWSYIRNSVNKGPMVNFIECAEKCHGDIIFFSDQDDVWEIDKVERMMDVFRHHTDTLLVSCSEIYMDENGNLLKGQSRFHKEKDKRVNLRKIDFSEQVRTMHSPGLTLAFRKELLEETKKFTYSEKLTYDLTMGLVASVKGGMYRLYEPLVKRRIHTQNASAPKFTIQSRVRNFDAHIKGRKLQLQHFETMYKYYSSVMTNNERNNLKKRISSTQKAINYMENRNFLGLLGSIYYKNPMENTKLNFANVIITYLNWLNRRKYCD